jgi:hypothetical protein
MLDLLNALHITGHSANRGLLTVWQPVLIKYAAVLEPVEARPGNVGARF